LEENTLIVNGFSSKVPATLFNKWLQDMFSNHCRFSDGIRAGTHTLKVTAFLLAIMGGGEYHSIKRNARHADDRSAFRYYTDGRQTHERIKNNTSLLEQQPCWKFRETLAHQAGTNQERLNRFVSNRRDMSIHEVVEFFIKTMLQVPPSSPHYRNPEFLLQRSYDRNFSVGLASTDPYVECMAHLQHLPSAVSAPISGCLQRLVFQRASTSLCPTCSVATSPSSPNAAVEFTGNSLSATTGVALSTASALPATPPIAPNAPNIITPGVHDVHSHLVAPSSVPNGCRHSILNFDDDSNVDAHQGLRSALKLTYLFPCLNDRSKYDVDSDFLKSLRLLLPNKKVQSLYALLEEILSVGRHYLILKPDDRLDAYTMGKSLFVKTRKYIFTRFLDKFHHCFVVHFSKDTTRFLERYPDFKHTSFSCNCV
jgi:hypothetical protein